MKSKEELNEELKELENQEKLIDLNDKVSKKKRDLKLRKIIPIFNKIKKGVIGFSNYAGKVNKKMEEKYKDEKK